VKEVSPAEARRIAVRAQVLDGSATDVLSTVHHLGRLQIDPISTVAPPQYLVLWSRLGPYERAELDRLLWEQKKLFEWNAFIYPTENLPLFRALMREPWGHLKWNRWAKDFRKEKRGSGGTSSASSSATARCPRGSSSITLRASTSAPSGGAPGRR